MTKSFVPGPCCRRSKNPSSDFSSLPYSFELRGETGFAGAAHAMQGREYHPGVFSHDQVATLVKTAIQK
jgi:hypothetical protein